MGSPVLDCAATLGAILGVVGGAWLAATVDVAGGAVCVASSVVAFVALTAPYTQGAVRWGLTLAMGLGAASMTVENWHEGTLAVWFAGAGALLLVVTGAVGLANRIR